VRWYGKYGRARQATYRGILQHKRFAYWIIKAKYTHSEYIMFIAFPWQQWLGERTSMLRLYVHCFSFLQWCSWGFPSSGIRRFKGLLMKSCVERYGSQTAHWRSAILTKSWGFVIIIQTKRLMLLREISAVYYTKHNYTVWAKYGVSDCCSMRWEAKEAAFLKTARHVKSVIIFR
jgi:hypothetical protein